MPAFLFSIVGVFFHHARKFVEPGTEGGAIEACQMDDLLYPERSIDHLDFSSIKGIFLHTVPLCTFTFCSDCLRNEKFLKEADTCTEIM